WLAPAVVPELADSIAAGQRSFEAGGVAVTVCSDAAAIAGDTSVDQADAGRVAAEPPPGGGDDLRLFAPEVDPAPRRAVDRDASSASAVDPAPGVPGDQDLERAGGPAIMSVAPS